MNSKPVASPVTLSGETGSNYVANKECRPTEVRFNNGRRVYIKQDAEGAYLEVEMMKPGEAWLRNAAEAEDGAFVGVGNTPYNRAVLAIIDSQRTRDHEGNPLSEGQDTQENKCNFDRCPCGHTRSAHRWPSGSKEPNCLIEGCGCAWFGEPSLQGAEGQETGK